MFSFFLALFFKAFFLPILLVAVLDWLTMSRDRKARVLRRQGFTYAKIAARLSCSPTTARRLCLSAI